MKYDLCCVGHITLDKVITPKNTVHMPGGTSYYCSHALRNLNTINYALVASLASSELSVVDDLKEKGVEVKHVLSANSVYFENKYGENQDDRTQRVLAKADPFLVKDIEGVDSKIYLLGALLSDDFSLSFVKELSKKGLVAIDSQGYLREVIEQQVHAIDWKDKLEFFKYVHFLKANEMEMEVLTGETSTKKAAEKLYNWGIKEVIITLGSHGSIIYDGKTFSLIPAYRPSEVIDATGCGDTYMAGYLYKRAQGVSIQESGQFGAAMATIKIENMGYFNGTEEDILDRINHSEKRFPSLT